MKHLARIQAQFQAHVLSGSPAIDSEIGGASAEIRSARLGIYRDAYRLRLIEVLGTDYDVLRKYLGDELFDAAASDYVGAHPSTFRNVRWFGGGLAQFLRTMSRYAEHPVLAELAQFEWTLGLAFDSTDSRVVRFEDVAALPPEAWSELRFAAHDSLHAIDLRTNTVAIWKSIDARDGFDVDVAADPVTWAIWRKGHSPFFRSLENDEAAALKAMLDRASFGEICGVLCEWIDEDKAALRAAGLLRGWVEEGWIAELLVET